MACPVFISLRLKEDDGTALTLKEVLKEFGVSAFLCNPLVGDELAEDISNAIDACEVFVVVGTRGFGEQGDSGFSTRQELLYAVGRRKPIVLIQRCDEFAHPLIKFYASTCLLHVRWEPGTRMPPELLECVLGALELGVNWRPRPRDETISMSITDGHHRM
jgi:hypothetical protein